MSHKYPQVIELELWALPGSRLPPEIAKMSTAPQCNRDLGLEEGIVLGLSEIPDKAHVDTLTISLDRGELALEDFERYCRDNSLNSDVYSMESAARFLEYQYGRALAWVHLAASQAGLKIGERINSWAHDHNYCLINPHIDACFLNGASLGHLLPQGLQSKLQTNQPGRVPSNAS